MCPAPVCRGIACVAAACGLTDASSACVRQLYIPGAIGMPIAIYWMSGGYHVIDVTCVTRRLLNQLIIYLGPHTLTCDRCDPL